MRQSHGPSQMSTRDISTMIINIFLLRTILPKVLCGKVLIGPNVSYFFEECAIIYLPKLKSIVLGWLFRSNEFVMLVMYIPFYIKRGLEWFWLLILRSHFIGRLSAILDFSIWTIRHFVLIIRRCLLIYLFFLNWVLSNNFARSFKEVSFSNKQNTFCNHKANRIPTTGIKLLNHVVTHDWRI
jgi:hypothetical protein